MNTPIYLDPALVPVAWRGIDGYNGRKFKAVVGETMTVPIDAGLWSGGSRELYLAIDFETGKVIPTPGQGLFYEGRKEIKVTLSPQFCIVKHSHFCGTDMGLTFYVHPENATKMLPAPVDLTDNENIVLEATASLKSSYNGKDRYQMSQESWRWGDQSKPFPSRKEWDAAKATLIEKGMLDKRGAITVKGKNARKK